MRNAEHERDAKDLGLRADELVWVERVTRSIAARHRRSAGAGVDDALQSVRVEVWESREFLAAIPVENRQSWLHRLIARAILRAAIRDRVQSRDALSLEALLPQTSSAEMAAGVVDEYAALEHDLRSSVGREDLAIALARLEPRSYSLVRLLRQPGR